MKGSVASNTSTHNISSISWYFSASIKLAAIRPPLSSKIGIKEIINITKYLPNGKLGKIVVKLEQKANSKKDQIERLKYLGLVLFVGIPLPGTGAWTGCLIAALLGIFTPPNCGYSSKYTYKKFC